MERNLKQVDIIIIGAGPIGLYASYIANNYSLSNIIIEHFHKSGGSLFDSQYPESVIDFPGDSKNPKEFAHELERRVELLHTPIYYNTQIEACASYTYPSCFQVKLTNGLIYETKAIIIATGNGIFKPKYPPKISNVEKYIQEGKISFQLDADVSKLTGETIVVGSNEDAINFSYAASNFSSVNLISPSNYLIDDEICNHNNVFVYHNYEVTGITDKDVIILNKMQHLSGHIPYNQIFFFYGWKRIQETLLKDFMFDVTENGNYLVDSTTQETSIKRIFSVGDCCAYLHKRNTLLSGFVEAEKAVINSYVVKHGSYPKDKYYK